MQTNDISSSHHGICTRNWASCNVLCLSWWRGIWLIWTRLQEKCWQKRTIYNYRYSRGRRYYIECTFGLLCNKFRIFHWALNVNVQLTVDIIKTCCTVTILPEKGKDLESNINIWMECVNDMDTRGKKDQESKQRIFRFIISSETLNNSHGKTVEFEIL